MCCFTAFAEFGVAPNDSIVTILQRQNGNRVTVQLVNGRELTGRIRNVSSQLLYLEGLEGRDYFDAAIAITRINAIIVRVKGGVVSETQKP